MAERRIIVIGGSAGSIEALTHLLGGLPRNLPAAIFVVLHISPSGNSKLPQVLSRRIAMPIAFAKHGEPIEPGRVYMSPPDWHMLIRAGYIELSHGPRENHTRPAIDPTFRSAALAYDSRVIGVILSGVLDDGAAGAAVVKAAGGVIIAQDPEEALYDSMPRATIRYVENIDYVAQSTQIAQLLIQLTEQPQAITDKEVPQLQGEHNMDEKTNNIDGPASSVVQHDIDALAQNLRTNALTIYTCPDCGGTLWQVNQSNLTRFVCHVGHAWSPEIALMLKTEQLEAALWTAARLLTEKATMTRQFANLTREAGDNEQAQRIIDQAELDEQHLRIVKEQLLEARPNPNGQAVMATSAMHNK